LKPLPQVALQSQSAGGVRKAVQRGQGQTGILHLPPLEKTT